MNTDTGRDLLYMCIFIYMGFLDTGDLCIRESLLFGMYGLSSLLEPSYRAAVTDILSKEEFSKANGLVSLAGSARYLFSPIIAGFLLGVGDIPLLLIALTLLRLPKIKELEHKERSGL